jgi:hypothetical protein
MATEIKSRDDLQYWLKGVSVADARLIASRAALRVLPLISGIASVIYDRRRNVAVSTSSIFRASSLAWVASKYPTQTNELSHVTARAVIDEARAVIDDALWASVFPADADPEQVGTIFGTANAANAAATAVRAAYFADAANNSANAVSYAATSDVDEQVWQSVSADALALDGGLAPDLLASRPLWPGGIPHSIAARWQTLVQSLPPNEDWDVWTAWYDRRLMGRVYPEAYELVFARVPDEAWEKGPAAANAWIKAELATLEPIPSDRSVAEFIELIQSSPEGAAVEIVHGKAQLAESGNQDDFAVADDPQTIQLHERVRKRALQARDKVARLANQRGFEAIADTVDEFARYISGDTRSVAANISVVWELSAAIGTFVERDDAARKGEGGLTQPMDAEPRESLDQVLTVAPAFIRRFPTAREHDRAVLESRRPRVSIETDKRVVEAARQNELLEQSLSKVLSIAASAAERSTDVQADKNRAWFGGTTRQIVVGFFGAIVLGSFVTGAFKEAGKEFWEHSQAGAAAGKFLLEKEADITELFKDLPADHRAALREIFRRLKKPRPEKPNADIPTEL